MTLCTHAQKIHLGLMYQVRKWVNPRVKRSLGFHYISGYRLFIWGLCSKAGLSIDAGVVLRKERKGRGDNGWPFQWCPSAHLD